MLLTFWPSGTLHFFGIQFQITVEFAYEVFFNLETAASVPASAVTPLYTLYFN